MIQDYFKKDIARQIETVIKADDRKNISDEVFEYVITDEIKKYLAILFDTYNTQGSVVNGVWISGHFGNGKSHLLKILSYVLENKEYDGYYSGEVFADKLDDDMLLQAEVKKAIHLPSESILFNIDQQSQITTKSDRNAILSVFYKVFYDHLGYYGFVPFIAEFERWLDKDGQYEDFKNEFNRIHPVVWEEARRDYFDPDVEDNIFEALSAVKGLEAERFQDILERLETNHAQSVESFGIIVNEYIKSKPKGFRLNFFVDEVGQYVGEDVQLMLNLQSIAETLATKTNGKSWIMITSQAEIQAMMDWNTKGEKDNFGRIQARFGVRIALTASSADEVVQKRLLTKKDKAQEELKKHYQQNESHLKTLLSFSDVGVQFKGYENDEDFADKYPMVPYQFSLFQHCRIALSKHDAFQGAHAAVGSRSMLGVFQQVIQSIRNQDKSALVSFDSMYEGIRSELQGTIQSNISLAENQLENSTAIRILKTLFMVKYFDQFKATKRNISVLLIDDQNIDLAQHEKDVERALLLLENQSYIQRSGEFYEYLTDKEKDIDVGIKNTEIDESAITTFLKEIFFDEIIKDNRITYIENKTAYDFSPIMNGVPFGREKELKVEIITSDYIESESTVQSHSMGTTILKLYLQPSATFSKDIRLYKQTEKYVKQKQNSSSDPEIIRTIQKVGSGNATRKRNIITMANQYLAQAIGFANGNRLEANGTQDGKTRVINTFQILVSTVYSNLPMLRNVSFTEDIVRETVRSKQDDLFGNSDVNLSEPEGEILTIVTLRKKQNERTSLHDLKEILIKKPFGWSPNAVYTLIARLYKSGRIELVKNSSTIAKSELIEVLLNSANHPNTLITPQATFDASKIKQLKEVYKDAFDEICTEREAKDVALAFREKLKEMKVEVEKLLVQQSAYPFLANLHKLSNVINRLIQQEYSYYINHAHEFEDELLDEKEDVLNPIQSFMNGEQKKIYDDIQYLLERDTGNLNYVEAEKVGALRNVMADEKPYLGSKIRNAKANMDEVKASILHLIQEERKITQGQVEYFTHSIQEREDFQGLDKSDQKEVLKPINQVAARLKEEKMIANIRELRTGLADGEIEALNLIQAIVAKQNSSNDLVVEPRVKYMRTQNIVVQYPKKELTSEEDVLEYLKAVKEEYLKKIKENIIITL